MSPMRLESEVFIVHNKVVEEVKNEFRMVEMVEGNEWNKYGDDKKGKRWGRKVYSC